MKKIIIGFAAVLTALFLKVFSEKNPLTHRYSGALLAVTAALGLFYVLTLLSIFFYEKKKRLILDIWTSVLSCLVVFSLFFVADLAIRRFHVGKVGPSLMPDAVVDHRLVPNAMSEYKSEDFHIFQRSNKWGLRGRDVSWKKEKNVYRVLLLGDSFTMGKGVKDDETAAVRLEKMLTDALGRKVEVLNAGVDSYAPILSYLQLKNFLIGLEPDLIVLNFDMSDLVQEDVYRSQAVRSGGEIVAVPAPGEVFTFTKRLDRWINSNLYFLAAAYRGLDEFIDRRSVKEEPKANRGVLERRNFLIMEHTVENEKERSREWKQVFESISRIKGLADRKKVPFFVAIYPWGHQVNEKEWQPGRFDFIRRGSAATLESVQTLERMSAENGIELLNAFPAFKAYSVDKPLYFNNDHHWTPEGNRLFAEELRDRILSKYLSARAPEGA